jgi:hypothetical protein
MEDLHDGPVQGVEVLLVLVIRKEADEVRVLLHGCHLAALDHDERPIVDAELLATQGAGIFMTNLIAAVCESVIQGCLLSLWDVLALPLSPPSEISRDLFEGIRDLF